MSAEMSACKFLQGGGEMGKLIRAKDWSKTPLGSPETWPQSLRTMVSVMLENPFGMYIAWGKDYTQIYNDGYRPILGATKHPKALGISTKETFTEIWHIIGSMFDGVMKGTPVGFPDFMLQLDRNGYLETCYFDFAYSPIRMENGEVGGVLVTVIETTNKKKAEDELKESKRELEFVIEASQLGTYDYNPITNKFTANARLKSWFGLPNDEHIELADAINAITENDKEKVSNAIMDVLQYSSGGVYDVEYTIINPISNNETVVHAKGRAWFNEDRVAYRLNGTVEDVTGSVLARKKIEENERNLRLMVLQAPMAIAILRGKDYKVEIVNKYALEIWGRTEEQVLNISVFDSMPELSTQGIKELLDDVVNTGNRFATDELPIKLLRNGNLETVYINFSYEALYNGEGKINGIMAIGFDVSPQVIAREKVEDIKEKYKQLIQGLPVAVYTCDAQGYVEIYNETAVELWGVKPEIGKDLWCGSWKIYKPDGSPLPLEECPMALSINKGRSVSFEIVIERPDKTRRTIIPNPQIIRDGDGNIIGAINTLIDITPQVVARKKIEESEQSIRTLVENAPFPIGVYEGEELRITLANQAIMDIWGKGNKVVGKLYTEILPELENQQIFQQIRSVLNSGIPFHAKNQLVELERNGSLKPYYFNYSFTPLIDGSGKIYGVMNTAADVTELHEAKQRVEDSEKRFKDSVKQAPIGIAIFRGADYVAEMANDSYLHLIDKSERQFIGKPLFESLPETKESLNAIIATIYRTGKAFFGYEFPVNLNRQGNPVIGYYNFVYQPLKEDHVITGFMVVVTDVTATVHANQIIEENEDKLNLIIAASELGMWEFDVERNEAIVSDRAYEILGFSGEKNLTTEQLSAHYHPEDEEMRQAAIHKASETGILQYQARLIHKDKSIHWIEVKGKVISNEDGKPKKMIGTIRDITNEKRFQQDLVEREEKFRLLADFMPQHVWTTDTMGTTNYLNQSVQKYSGLNDEQLKGNSWLQIIHPDDQDETVARWSESLKSGEEFLFEHRFRNANGEYRWHLSRALPQKNSQGEIKMWVGLSNDIQDQKIFMDKLESKVRQRTMELNQKNEELEKLNKELQSFIYISSHDLQEPLRKIQTFSSRILEKDSSSLSDIAKSHLKRMQNSADRMQNLIQDLFAYTRTNAQERKFEKVNLNSIVKEVENIFSEEIEQKNASIVIANKISLCVILIQFRQVMINLISNSLKYAKKDQPLEISIDCKVGYGQVFHVEGLLDQVKYAHIRISDNGIGFSQEDSSKIFEVFQRLHGKEEYSGTGIGLAIVKKIIENHDGLIIANGQPDKGATFDIYIPER